MKIQFIVFLVIGLISLIRSINQAKNQKEQVNRGDAPARRQKVPSEIEAFLTEVKSAAGTAAPVDQREQQAARKRAKQRRRQQARRARTQTNTAPPESSQRPLGSGISEHVDSYINKHIEDYVDSKVDDLVEVDIIDTVEDHLGNRSMEMPAATKTSSDKRDAAARFRELLKSREGVRQAILLNEVLARPRCLRT